MWEYNYTENLYPTELYHHGVLGMKWGHRKARAQSIKEAKARYKKRNASIQDRYDRTERSIEKNYKRGQQLSSKDYSRELKADRIATNSWTKSKAQYKSDIAKAKQTYKNAVAKDKADNAKYKKQLEKLSRYGKTSTRIAVDGILKNVGTRVITGGAAATAIAAGRPITARTIQGIGNTIISANTISTGYKIATNYKPRKSK